jgi:transcriptional regulator GlxA family with amidase domain
MRYLREVRLNRVHAELLSADPGSVSVSQVAARWGFLYLGRFTAAYREKFGQRPSETLRILQPAVTGAPNGTNPLIDDRNRNTG